MWADDFHHEPKLLCLDLLPLRALSVFRSRHIFRKEPTFFRHDLTRARYVTQDGWKTHLFLQKKLGRFLKRLRWPKHPDCGWNVFLFCFIWKSLRAGGTDTMASNKTPSDKSVSWQNILPVGVLFFTAHFQVKKKKERQRGTEKIISTFPFHLHRYYHILSSNHPCPSSFPLWGCRRATP